MVTPNRQETEKITGIEVKGVEDAKKAAKWIANKGVKDIVVKLGSEGNLLYESKKDKFTFIKATKVKAVNTVGAGDTFAGVLAARLAKKVDLISAVEFASKAAAIKVSRAGGQASIPTEEEVENF